MTAAGDTWISSHGVTMPRILYGTAWKKEKTAGLVDQAIKAGFRGLDTACQPKHYDEAGVGAGLAAAYAQGVRREDLYLQTKFTPLGGHDPQRVPYDPAAPLGTQVAQSFERSRHNLGTETLDGLLLHSPLENPADMAEVWRAMEAVFDAGEARHLGICNCYDLRVFQDLYDQSRVKPAVIQNRFYAKTGFDRLIRDYCRAHGILYQSFWTLTANPEILAHDHIKALMKAYGRTAPQIFFRFLSQIGIVPLTGTTSATHMREDLDIARFELTDHDCRSIETLLL